ncbi:MAG: cyanophycin synthetase, partial [Cyanobacteria bacterium J06639_1]
GNARCGQGEYLVAEVDESDGSLVKLHPTIGVITNIELDHPDHFQSLEQVVEVFQQYARQSEIVVASLDCPTIAAHIPVDIGYSIAGHPDARIRADNVRYLGHGTVADIWEGDRCLGELHVRLLGAHNLSNALAVVAVARHLGVEFEAIAKGIASFGGAKRRFEIRGQVNGVTFVDDYAHHPTELEATLTAAKLQQRRVVAIFQPHRYSRTTLLFDEFAEALALADLTVLVPIYSAGESPSLGREECSAEALAQHVRGRARASANRVGAIQPEVHYEAELTQIPQRLAGMIRDGDLVLFLGAGNLNQSIPAAIAAYENSIEPLEALAS